MADPVENDLIHLVKDEADSKALITLADRHTGIYFTVASRYAAQYPDVIKLDDLSDDKLLNLYRFILDYKPDQGMKLGTYIGERTDYLCKDLLKKERHDPLAARWSVSGDQATHTEYTTSPAYQMGVTYTPAPSHQVVDQSAASVPRETVNQDLGIALVLETIEANPTKVDSRFLGIVKMKHLATPGQATLSWRQIGRELSLSHEMARKIYVKNMAVVKRCLKRRASAAT